jgi:hypothetical protein
VVSQFSIRVGRKFSAGLSLVLEFAIQSDETLSQIGMFQDRYVCV